MEILFLSHHSILYFYSKTPSKVDFWRYGYQHTKDACPFIAYCVNWIRNCIYAITCVFQQGGILTSVDSDEPVQPPFKLRNSKWCSVNSLTVTEYSSDKQRLWSDCAYVQADLRLCWSYKPHCWKSHVTAHFSWSHSLAMFAFTLIAPNISTLQ